MATRMMTNTLMKIVTCLLLVGLPVVAQGLGLGKLQVNSALDQPLDAEIRLSSVQPGDAEALEVTLGTPEDFVRAGVARSTHLGLILFEVVQGPGGGTIVRLSSEEPLKEPFLHFLVAAEWPGGKLVREYTALLDPPLYAEGAPAVTEPLIPAAVEEPTVPEEIAEEMAEAPAPEPEAAPEPTLTTTESDPLLLEAAPEADTMDATGDVSVASAEDSYGPTRKGDTLWGIVTKALDPAGSVNIYQMMIGLLRENPDAFIDGNINLLKVDQTLNTPSTDALAAISLTEAQDVYAEQLAAFDAYKLALAGAAPSAPTETVAETSTETVAAAESESEATGTDAEGGEAAGTAAAETAAETEAAAGQQDSEEILRIVQATIEQSESTAEGEASAGATAVAETAAETEALRGQITTMEETLLSRELEITELQERIKGLEEQVQNTSRLLELESAELAAAQAQAGQDQAGQDQAAAPTEPTQQTEPSTVAETQDTAVTPQQPAQAEPVVAPTPSQPWWQRILDEAVENRSTWLLFLLAPLLLIVGVVYFARRRRSIAEFEESVLTGSALDTPTASTSTGTATSDVGTDTSFLSDFGVPGMGTMQADEVDPLAEAEVYLAYGRDEQAEEVLKEAITRAPTRHELKIKLLEIYEQRQDLKAFETLAEELYPAQGEEQSEVWSRVVEMGQKMNPDNPLFKAVPAVAVAGAVAAAAANDAGSAAMDEFEATEELPMPGSTDPGTEPFPDPAEVIGADVGDDSLSEALTPFPTPDAAPAEDLGLADVGEGVADAVGQSAGSAGLDFDLDLDAGKEALGAIDEATGGAMDPTDLGAMSAAENSFDSVEPFAAAHGDTGDTEGIDMDLSAEFDLAAGMESVNPELADTPALMAAADGTASIETNSLDMENTVDIKPTEEFSDFELDASDQSTVAQADAAGSQMENAFDPKPAPVEEFSDFTLDPTGEVEPTRPPADTSAPGGQVQNIATAPTETMDAPQWDEAATKLDLAQAYIDMGDSSGARTIIDEVLRDGNEGQRKQAAELASKLAS